MKIAKYILLACIISVVFINAQTTPENLTIKIDSTQKLVVDKINKENLDKELHDAIIKIATARTDSLQQLIKNDTLVHHSTRLFLYDAIDNLLNKIIETKIENTFYFYGIDNVHNHFEKVAINLLHNKNNDEVFANLALNQIEPTTNNFNANVDATQPIVQLKTYYEIINNPSDLLTNLKIVSKRNFLYQNKLIDYIIYNYPDKLIFATKANDKELKEIILTAKNPYVNTIFQLSESYTIPTIVLPFIDDYAKNPEILDEINQWNKDKIVYFQKLVDKKIEAYKNNSPFINFLKRQTKLAASLNITYPINEAHNKPDNQRFAILKNLRAQDTHIAMVTDEDNLYTSTFLGMYKIMMTKIGENPDEFLTNLDNVRNNKFLRLISDYGMLNDFFDAMPKQKINLWLDKFITPYQGSAKQITESAMRMADAFYNIIKNPQYKPQIDERIDNMIALSQKNKDIRNEYVYRKLKSLLNYSTADYKKDATLTYKKLLNSKGNIVTVMYFYGDDDGRSSFENFKRTHSKKQWEIAENKFWIEFVNKKNNQLKVFANKPLDEKKRLDTPAQDSMVTHLKQLGETTSILIHRGHSYYVFDTLLRQTGTESLAILGSCGGYDYLFDIFKKNPEVEIIATKQIGSKFVNDPMFDEIFKSLEEQKDIDWETIWIKLYDRLKNNNAATDLLNEYVPPHKNFGLLLLRELSYGNISVKN